jgi:hypothetical protein
MNLGGGNLINYRSVIIMILDILLTGVFGIAVAYAYVFIKNITAQE